MNGWENYETWNVALWINNNEGFYNIARRCHSYEQFCENVMELCDATMDGVRWDDNNINIEELNNNIFEDKDF